ncbi:ABC transporter ATP-binding protein [Enterococcus saccharolyticus]|uniref:Dipeptide/oligopeptide/nickel ABC transporter ATP-binding protein n=1 Tax=Candidatus Enterococcus willemsii TaxID=1857215 RepID=A0ABQ6Z2A4_9ENTE|nr:MULTISPECIES: ABC transporter ATP-binding protein [Enterococcus]KAF1305733.1 dipeptide/oligopeptide/nickel ABC transporter ATP-binding protein [Enterococcus sp. CU12B]MCD5001493.1 ABC transporter ATP-binding protein [Enterococcus saccharolyticus]
METENMLSVENLSIDFVSDKKSIRAVENVSFHMKKGEVLGIVGESGSGKSVTVTSILKLLPQNARYSEGKVLFKEQDLLTMNERDIRSIRGKEISMIFQDPMTSLNPVFTVENQLVEAIRLHQKMSKKEAKKEAVRLLNLVGIKDAEKRVKLYPHEFSGGMRQRVMIAMAISSAPSLLIADEPTTALDVTVQKQIIDLLKDLQAKIDTGVIFITHDLEVVADIADNIMIMYAGEVVESGSTQTIFEKPLHPYTRLLINAIPKENKSSGRLPTIEGNVPSLADIPRGVCRFADRIPWIDATAHEENPQLREVEAGHFVRCTCYKHFHLKEEVKGG